MNDSIDELAQPLRELRARFEAQVEPHRQHLWSYCRRLTGSVWDAEDLVQEVMQRALAGLANFWQPLNARAYLFRIATNLWIDRKRREVRAEFRDVSNDTEVHDGPDVRAAAHQAIAQLVDELTPLQRIVFLLCESFDFRTAEVADLLSTTDGAVKAALHRARVALAKARTNPRETSTAIRSDQVRDAVVRRYIEAFDARDPDAIAALLHENAVTNIIGSAVEIGREVSRNNSLREWAQEPCEQWANPGVLEEREVLFILVRDPGTNAEVLYSILELEISGGLVSGQKNYFFSPELLVSAAEELGITALTRGHQYVLEDTAH